MNEGGAMYMTECRICYWYQGEADENIKCLAFTDCKNWSEHPRPKDDYCCDGFIIERDFIPDAGLLKLVEEVANAIKTECHDIASIENTQGER